ncbi:DUF3131 domain-containing protein [Ramlibacter sp. AN1015]|uniref:DUF3131 domain-containing protein n=1 Tax=Ramlibacter sp. AN1015 TaxID=3133428 RepID=UPI0030C26FC4
MDHHEPSNFVKARSSVVWILAILVAFSLVWWIESTSRANLIDAGSGSGGARAGRAEIATSADLPPLPSPRALTPQELEWARTAWAYFEAEADPATGLVGSVQGHGGATLWDIGSQVLATVAARELGLVPQREFDARVQRMLYALQRLPLHAGALPNKSYDVRSLAMTDYANRPVPEGVGWSALDVGRGVIALVTLAWRAPEHAGAVREVLARWDLSQLVREGDLIGRAAGDNGHAAQLVQEGRLGYEQYAARGAALVALTPDRALDWQRNLRLVEVQGVQLPVDVRDPAQFGAQNFIVSDPFVMAGLELGWDRLGREFAWRVLRAQEARFRQTSVPTAVTEDHIDRAPWFLYNSVFSGGQPWATVTEDGTAHPELRTLSVKAAFGWHALFRTAYTQRLVEEVAALHEPGKGWYAGRYEQDQVPNRAITTNTNAVVLESLAYIAAGPLLRFDTPARMKGSR